jgi:hypothetical protein
MRGLSLVIGLALLTAGPALAQDKPPIVARAEQCLRDNVDRVVAAEPDIQSAASFLVNFACAPQVSAEARYEMNLLVVKTMVGTANNMPIFRAPPGVGVKPPTPLAATVDPDSGDIIVSPPPPGEAPNPVASTLANIGAKSTSGADFGMQQTAPASLRKLAADLVLHARERQLGKAP